VARGCPGVKVFLWRLEWVYLRAGQFFLRQFFDSGSLPKDLIRIK
jgi:hypothetical protein